VLQLPTTGNTWVYTSAGSSLGSIDSTKYKVSYGDPIDIRVKRLVANGASRNLTMTMWFVLE